MPQLVQAPTRRPRQGGIKTIVGEFIAEPRLTAAMGGGGIAWEDSGSGFTKGTRAGCYAAVEGTNEVQTITITGTPTGGAFKLTFLGQTTGDIAYNAAASAVQSALVALSTIGAGNVAVTGGPGPGTPYVVTFQGTLGLQNVNALTATNTFTGGSSPAIGIVTTTAGRDYAPKTGDGISQHTSISDPFVRYAGVECFLGGDQDGPSYRDQAATLLEQGEDRAIESVLWTWAVAAGSPGTATTIAGAVALVEEQADTAYVGAPVIVMSREAADLAFAAHVLTREDGKLITPNGNLVLATGTAPSGDVGKVIAIGQPAVYANTQIVAEAPGLDTNRDMAIAERAYAIGVDTNYRYMVAVSSLTP